MNALCINSPETPDHTRHYTDSRSGRFTVYMGAKIKTQYRESSQSQETPRPHP